MSEHSNPDEQATGITSGGERWSVARYGALVVTQVDDDADDEQWPDEQAARREFADQVATLRAAD